MAVQYNLLLYSRMNLPQLAKVQQEMYPTVKLCHCTVQCVKYIFENIFLCWCIILTINFMNPNSTFHLLSKKCPRLNLDTNFVNKKTAATLSMTFHIGATKVFG